MCPAIASNSKQDGMAIVCDQVVTMRRHPRPSDFCHDPVEFVWGRAGS